MILRKLSQSLRITLALMVATFSSGLLQPAVAYAQGNPGTPPGQTRDSEVEEEVTPTSTSMAWGVQGQENKDPECSMGQDSYWHWILTPGGPADITEAELTVIYESGEETTTQGVFRSESGNGAMHFDVTVEGLDVVESANVDFTYTGNANNPVLTISHNDCIGETNDEVITPPLVDSVVVCGPDNDEYSVEASANYTVDANENGTFTVTANAGSVFTGGLTSVVLTPPEDMSTECEEEEPEYYLSTSHSTMCGEMTISLRNVSPWIYPVSYSTDGSTPNASGPNYGPVVDNRGDAPDDQTKTKTLTFTEDQNGGEVTVKYVIAAGTESDLYMNLPVGQVTTLVVDTDCQDPEVVTPTVCPANMAFSDMNQNGRVDEGECFKKVFVCKYVGTPGIDERLQTGDNPINVSVNAIPAGATVGAYFADGQDRSFVLAFDEGQEEPNVSECPNGDSPSVCTVSNNNYIAPWMYNGETYPFADEGGVFEFKTDGLYLSTPTVDAYVYGFIDAGNTKLSNVDAMSYETLRLVQSAGYEGTLPAYLLYVDTNGTTVAGGEKYMFYEPYYNGTVTEGTWQTWDAYSNGEAKWYISGTGQTLRTWDYFVDSFPDAIVLAYGFNQGQSNAETYAAIQDMTFDCATTTFGMTGGQGGGGNQGGNNGGGQVQGDSTVKTPVTTTTTPQTLGAAVLPAVLPATGANDSPLMILAAALLAYGAAYFLQGRRLITRKEMIGA